jgi:hypothetical protein
VRFEFVAWVTSSSQFDVIVDLAIDSQNLLPIIAKERLCAGINADNCKTLMDENGALTNVTSGPVGTTVALSLGESNKSRPVSGGVW